MAYEKISRFSGGILLGALCGWLLRCGFENKSGAESDKPEFNMLYGRPIVVDDRIPEPPVRKRGGLFGIKNNVVVGLATHPEKYEMAGKVVGGEIVIRIFRKEEK